MIIWLYVWWLKWSNFEAQLWSDAPLSGASNLPISCVLHSIALTYVDATGRLTTIMWCDSFWQLSNHSVCVLICAHSNTITWWETWLTTITSHDISNIPNNCGEPCLLKNRSAPGFPGGADSRPVRWSSTYFRATYYTPYLTNMNIHWKTSLKVRWKMPLTIHDDFWGVDLWRAIFRP